MAFPQLGIDKEYGDDVDDEDIIQQLKSEKVYNRFKFDTGILLRGEKENIIDTFNDVVRSAQPKERKSIAKLLNANKGKFRVDVYGRRDIYDFENAPDYQIDQILHTYANNERPDIKKIQQFLRCYVRLPVAQTLNQLGYSDLTIEGIPDAQKEEILAKQTPYPDFIRDRSRAFNAPHRPRPRPREFELPDHMKGGRRRKTKKSKRRARKTRRRHK
jgi:hypothetical protein